MSSVKYLGFSFAINDLETPDICTFYVKFEQSNKFCDRSWGEIEPVKVLEELETKYPQFITLPITGWYFQTRKNSCNKLWKSEEYLEME